MVMAVYTTASYKGIGRGWSGHVTVHSLGLLHI